MSEGDFEADWNTDFFGVISTPVPVKIQCDESFDRAKEDGSKLADFRPPSAFNDDLTFHEMTPALVEDDLFSAAEVRQEIKEEKADDEPCVAALAIEANLPTPDPVIVSQWRTFISTAYYHPNIMAHGDVACLKQLFQFLGSDLSYESINVMIELGKTDHKPTYNIRPPLPASKQAPLLTFANVTDFFIDNDLQICIVKNYSINDSMKKAVAEMANFIIEYPEALYLETYGFILDFLLRFGVNSRLVIDAVVNTQKRRRKSLWPASTLVVKQANTLGKGKKEFLEKRFLDSPEQKFNPVVPIISEPMPMRLLRNRRGAGSLEEQTPNTPDIADTSIPSPQKEDGNEDSQATISATESSDLNTTSVATPTPVVTTGVAMKRKLFIESGNKKMIKKRKQCGKINASGQLHTVERHDVYLAPSGAKLMRRKKSFYHRRDDSQIEKPFVCKICPDRCFAYKGNLVLHMKKHHPQDARNSLSPKQRADYVPPFVCPLCQKGYSSKYKCQLHIRQLHPDKAHIEPIANENGTLTPKSTPTPSPSKNSPVQTSKLSPNKLSNKIAAKSKMKKVSNGNNRSSVSGETVDIVQQSLEAAEIQPGNSSRSSSTSSENSASELSSHSYTSKEQLDIHMSNGINVSFEDIPYTNINHAATRQQLSTAVQ